MLEFYDFTHSVFFWHELSLRIWKLVYGLAVGSIFPDFTVPYAAVVAVQPRVSHRSGTLLGKVFVSVWPESILGIPCCAFDHHSSPQ